MYVSFGLNTVLQYIIYALFAFFIYILFVSSFVNIFETDTMSDIIIPIEANEIRATIHTKLLFLYKRGSNVDSIAKFYERISAFSFYSSNYTFKRLLLKKVD